MTMQARLPDWSKVETLLAAGFPVALNLPGAPAAELQVSNSPPCLRLELAGADLARPLPELPDAIAAQRVHADDGVHLAISTTRAEVFAQFYALLGMVLDEAHLLGAPPEVALGSALEAWRRLLAVEPRTTLLAQAGLLGELWVLEAHLRRVGPPGVDAWVGPRGEPHDFRFVAVDLEVKTTTQESRQHMISSLGQLSASPGRPLLLLSLGVQAAPAAGRSVPDVVASIREHLGGEPIFAARFERSLKLAGWNQSAGADAARFIIRLGPEYLEVGATTPRIVHEHLDAALGQDGAARVVRVQYTVDLTGLTAPLTGLPLSNLLDPDAFHVDP
jgi:hypothetical protein